MPKRTTTTGTEADYSSEFRLRVVLEYIRNPKQLKRISQKNHIGEELLTTWYQQFNERADQIFSNPAPSSGIRLNTDGHQSIQPSSSSKEPPAWLFGYNLKTWNDERGVVVWHDATQKIKLLSAREALELLAKLRRTSDWRTAGISITRRIRRQKSSEKPKQNRSRKKSRQQVSEISEPEFEDIEEEHVRLDPQAGGEVLAFLEEHENRLKKMAEDDEKRRLDALVRAYSFILSWKRDDEAT